jgi:6-phosphogluconolactonase (cycloisomerase 2 family)
MAFLRSALVSLLLLPSALALWGCGGGSGVASGPAPSALSYSSALAQYAVCQPIAPNTPTLIGGQSTFTVTPALPAGLTLNPNSGLITGAPTVLSPATIYSVTATNASGQISTPLLLAVVLGAPPSGLTYTVQEANYGVGFPIVPNVPTVIGSVDQYTVSPPLPAGLTLNPVSGVISGTPAALSPQTNYTVTARNCVLQSTATILRLTVANPNVPPGALSYITPTASYVGCAPITPNTPILLGFANLFTVNPPLPAGLALDSTTGRISGTPTQVQATATHTVTAANGAGSISTDLNIAVLPPAPPTGLSYSINDATLLVGILGSPLFPSLQGIATSYSVTPALPTGLALDPLNGLIGGVPLAVTPQGTFTVTATDCVGQQTSTMISIEVADPQAPPAGLTYATPAPSYPACETIVPNVPTVNGLVLQYMISPPLPSGLSFDTSTGVISGAANLTSPAVVYTVTGLNSVGQTQTTVTLSVTAPSAPSGLTYPLADVAYTVGEAALPNVPTIDGEISLWTVVPPLPAGLTLDQETGEISGLPLAAATATVHTITAADCLGQATSSAVTITVVDPSQIVPRFLFTANADGTVSGLTIDPNNGKLRHNGYAVAGTEPVDLEVSRSERDLYVLNAGNGSPGSANVVLLRIDQSNGRLSPVGAPSTLPDGSFPSDVLISEAGDRLYVANTFLNSISAFRVSLDGTLTPVAGSPFTTVGVAPRGLGIDPLGRFLFAAYGNSSSVSSFRIDPATGALSNEITSSFSGSGAACAAQFSSNGTLTVQVVASSPNRILPYTVNPTTGALTALTPESLGAAPNRIQSITIGSDRLVYVSTATQVERFVLNELGQPFKPLPITPYVVPSPVDLVFSANGAFAFVALEDVSEISTAAVQPSTSGQLLPISPSVSPIDRIRVRQGPRAIRLSAGSQAVERITSFVYATNASDSDVSQYAFNPGGPGLTALSPAQINVGVTPNDVQVHPFEDWAYVVDAAAGTLLDLFSFDIAGDGQLSISGTYNLTDAVTAGDGAWALEIEPSGRFAYVVRSGGPVSQLIRYSIDPTTGLLSPGGAVDAGDFARFPAIDPTGQFLYVPNSFAGSVSQYRIDATTGALTALGTIAAGAGPFAATVDETGRFVYVANRGSSSISGYAINADTGVLTSLGAAVAAGTTPTAVRGDALGRILIVANEGGGTLTRYLTNLNPFDATVDGTIFSLGNTSLGGGPRWVDFDATGTRLFTTLVTTGDILTLSVDIALGGVLTVQDTDASATTSGTRNVASVDRVN